MKETVAAVVVTYNRKNLLIECLDALRKQNRKPDAIFIIDNKSTDGTPQILIKNNYIPELLTNDLPLNQLITHQITSLSSPPESIEINYIRKFENDGGAGGFYEGMKQAYEAGYDWIWMMDDDGIAENNQLLELLNAPKKYKYRNALVIDIKDNSKLAFGLKGYNKVSDITEKIYIENEANPFNGTLIKREIPEKIGLIKKEMFIWGDESEYLKRAKTNKFEIVTVKPSIHFHPQNKGKKENVIPFIKKYQIVIKPKSLSHFYYRNLAYVKFKYGERDLTKKIIFYIIYYAVRLDIREMLRLIKYSIKGIRNDFK